MLPVALVALLVGLGPQAAEAGGFFTNGVPPAGGSQYPFTLPLTGNETIPADTNLANGQSPQSESISSAQLGSALAPQGNPRNFLENGDMGVNQQGTGAITGGTTTVTALQFAADRWFVDTNVGSGAGQAQIITASPAPPTGFTQSVKVWRNSGALTQPVCTLQEIETSRATELAGKTVVLSTSLQPLAGITSTAGQVSGFVITGTGTDEGLATLTASPAITPAWTGIATAGQSTWALGTTAVWARYNTGPVAIPATATEVGVEICFTPAGSSSGATDGFAVTGVQLEAVASNSTLQPVGPSAFEWRPLDYEVQEAQRFFMQLNEPASAAGTPITCGNIASASQVCQLNLRPPMRGTTPVVVIPTTGTFKMNIAGTPTTWTTPTAGTCSTTACVITASTTDATVGNIAPALQGGGGSGVVYVKNDKVM